MDFLAMVNAMPREIYLSLKESVETGKWQNGEALTPEQKENALQAVLAWQAKHEQTNDHLTIGEDGHIIERKRSELKKQFSSESNEIVRIQHNDL